MYTGDTPTLVELEGLETKSGKHIDVLADIGTDYETFGHNILEDDKGTKVDVIKEDQGKASKSKREIARQWLRGKGKQPVTWGTLVQVLESTGLKELAREIRGALQ